jgi:hypothetical protein
VYFMKKMYKAMAITRRVKLKYNPLLSILNTPRSFS